MPGVAAALSSETCMAWGLPCDLLVCRTASEEDAKGTGDRSLT